jgi:hypothetical protein
MLGVHIGVLGLNRGRIEAGERGMHNEIVLVKVMVKLIISGLVSLVTIRTIKP